MKRPGMFLCLIAMAAILALAAVSFPDDKYGAPPVVVLSTSEPGEPYDVTLVHSNLDLDSAMDDYGIYHKLNNLQDADVIVRRDGVEYELSGFNAAEYLLRAGYVYYREGVGLIASDRLKGFLNIRDDTTVGGGAPRRNSGRSPATVFGSGGSQLGRRPERDSGGTAPGTNPRNRGARNSSASRTSSSGGEQAGGSNSGAGKAPISPSSATAPGLFGAGGDSLGLEELWARQACQEEVNKQVQPCYDGCNKREDSGECFRYCEAEYNRLMGSCVPRKTMEYKQQ